MFMPGGVREEQLNSKLDVINVSLGLFVRSKVDDLIRKQVEFGSEGKTTLDRWRDIKDDVATRVVLTVEDRSLKVVNGFDKTLVVVESITKIEFEFGYTTFSKKSLLLKTVGKIEQSTILS